jgi:lipopolysaccharide export system permease protein
MKLIVYSMPEFLRFTLPMSVMMGVLLTFIKMASDNEIIAIKACGGSIYHLMAPVVLFCGIVFLATFYTSVYGLAWGKSSYKNLEREIASKGADAAIKERVFNDSITDVVFYINQVSIKDKMFYDVFIEDMRNPKVRSTVVAPRGKRFVSTDLKDAFILRLFDGMVFRVNLADNTVNTIHFNTYDITIPLERKGAAAKVSEKRYDEMTIAELNGIIHDGKVSRDNRRLARAELHEKFSIPFACLTLGILAMPLGLKSAFSKKTSGLGLGMICFLAFYALMAFGWSSARSRLITPSLAMWLPNIVMGLLGIYFLHRVAREKTIGFEFIGNYYRSFRHRMKKKAGE